jgi:ABC-type glycerol-3-phosphate transport system substrate-binding protein
MLNRSTALRLLCAALAASILGAACQSSTPTPSSSAAPSSSTPASSSAAPASSEPASSEAGVKPLFDTKQELTVMREENASQVIRGDSLTNKWLEETHNLKITIEAVPAASYQDKKNVLISTNNMPDIMKVTMGEVRQYAARICS